MNRLAPLLAVAAALALGVGWFVSQHRVEAHARIDDAERGPRVSGAAVRPDAATDLDGDHGDRRDSTRTEVVAEVDPLAADAAAAVEAPVEDETPPQVVGRVLSKDGEPLADAAVVAATGWIQALPIELEELGQANDWLQRARATTDAEGRFVLEEGLSLGGELILHVSAPGHAPLRIDRPPKRGSNGAQLPIDYGDLGMRAGLIARGRVVDRMGQAVVGARLSLAVVLGEQGFGVDYPSRGVPLFVTGDDGAFVIDRLDRGPFTLLVDAPGRLIGRVTGVATERPLDSLVIVLEPGGGIVGKITGYEARAATATTAATLRPLRIEARPGKPDNSNVDGLERAHGGARCVGVSPEGAFEVNGLVDGLPYTLIATQQNEKGSWKRVVEIEPTLGWPGTRGLELRWQPRRVATLRIVDEASGAPVEACTVSWSQAQGGGRNRNNGFQFITEGGDGTPMKRHFDGGVATLDRLPPGREDLELSVKVTAVGFADKTVEHLIVKSDGTTDLGEIRLTSAPTVRVTVKVKETGETVAGAKVYMAKKSYQWLDWWVQNGTEVYGNDDVTYGVTDDAGVAIIASLPGQRVLVTAAAAGRVAHEPTEAMLSVAGSDEVLVELGDGGTLVARVRRPNGSPAEGVKVYCKKQAIGSGNNNGRTRELVTDAEGLARFERLPAGLHQASVSTEDQGGDSRMTWRSANVVVGGEVTVVLDAPAVGSLNGLVLEAGQPLARASLSLSPPGSGNEQNLGWGWGWGDEGASARQTTSRGDGTYTLGPLEAGEWLLTVRHPSRAMAIRTPIRIVEGSNVYDVRLDVALLEARVVDETGMPWPRLNVQVSAQGEDLGGGSQKIRMNESPTGDVNMNWDWESLDRASTDAEGHFAFRGIATARPLRVSVYDEFILPINVDLSDFADGELRDLGDLVAKAAGVVRARRAAQFKERLKVQLVRLAEEGDNGPESVTNGTTLRSGRTTTLNSVAPGRYRAELLDASGGVMQSKEIEVRPRAHTQVDFD